MAYAPALDLTTLFEVIRERFMAWQVLLLDEIALDS